jgi:hypothetical protein
VKLMLTRELISREEESSDLEPLQLFVEDGIRRVLSKVIGWRDAGRGEKVIRLWSRPTEMVGR